MSREPDRIEQFEADLAELRIVDPSVSRDQLAARCGLAGLVIGIALPIVAYVLSHGTDDAREQRDALVLAVLGVSVAVAGGALYLKGALAGFLRFWLLRDLHERRVQTDRIVGGDRAGESELT